jgi:hypothetical protein
MRAALAFGERLLGVMACLCHPRLEPLPANRQPVFICHRPKSGCSDLDSEIIFENADLMHRVEW